MKYGKYVIVSKGLFKILCWWWGFKNNILNNSFQRLKKILFGSRIVLNTVKTIVRKDAFSLIGYQFQRISHLCSFLLQYQLNMLSFVNDLYISSIKDLFYRLLKCKEHSDHVRVTTNMIPSKFHTFWMDFIFFKIFLSEPSLFLYSFNKAMKRWLFLS